jgi:FERM/RhoGEF/pleckstrin domain protein 2
MNLLDIARKIELFGIVMHPAKDHDDIQLNLAIAHMGVLVFQNYTKINTFSWAKIRKISFKRKKFLIKLHPEACGFYKDTVEFYFDNRDDSKNFWKICIEHHAFFRCVNNEMHGKKTKSGFLKRGSSFRYFAYQAK